MRHWERAGLTTICGFCADWIKKGDPVQIITLRDVDSRKERCVKCADAPVPENLPELEEK